SVEAQRLPEILLRRDEIDFFCQIQKSSVAYGRVQQEPPDLDAGSFDLALENIIHEPRNKAEIVKHVADADLNKIGHDEIVALGERLQCVLVQLAIELEHRRVERLPRIVLFPDAFISLRKRIERFFETFAHCRSLRSDCRKVPE